MRTQSPELGFSLRQAEKLVGLSRRFIESLVGERILRPGPAAPDDWRFSLRDMVVLRTAKALREARIPHRKVIQALRNVQDSLGEEGHLASVRLRAQGKAVEASDQGLRRDALSGQLLLPLEDGEAAEVQSNSLAATGTHGAPLHGGATPPRLHPRAGASGQAAPDADVSPAQLARRSLQQALRLEASDAAAAEAAYRQAIALDPCLDVAYVNLGAMLCEAHRCDEAVALYEGALAHCGDTPLIHFNRATALEDTGQAARAVEAYERALALDPGLADAHYNLGVLMEQLGDTQRSVRHFSAYRRLHQSEDS